MEANKDWILPADKYAFMKEAIEKLKAENRSEERYKAFEEVLQWVNPQQAQQANKETIEDILLKATNLNQEQCSEVAEVILKDLKPAQQAVWVKASEPDIKEGDYIAKYWPGGMELAHPYVGMAFVRKDYVRYVCPDYYDLNWPKGHEKLQYIQILDESSTSNYSEELRQAQLSVKSLRYSLDQREGQLSSLKEKAAKMEAALIDVKQMAESYNRILHNPSCEHIAKMVDKALEWDNEEENKPIKWDSEKVIGRVQERFRELENYKWEWRSFYNGWLEGRSDMIQKIKGWGQYKEKFDKLKATISKINDIAVFPKTENEAGVIIYKIKQLSAEALEREKEEGNVSAPQQPDIKFCMWLTGNDEAAIRQMLNDYLNGRASNG
jgi:hypothetical protein